MADTIIQPTFDPGYVPAVIDGETKPDSILIHCHDADTNVFTYNAWDGQPRWFELVKDGEVAFMGGMNVGDSFLMNNSSTWVVRYFVNEVYEYQVVNGQCATNATTSTTGDNPSTTSPTVTEPTSSSTTVPETSSTTSPIPEETTTTPSTLVTPTTESGGFSPTTEPQSSTSLESGPGRPEIMMDCRWNDSMSQFLRADGSIMAYEECSEAATPISSGPNEFAETGASLAPLLLIIAAVVIVMGSLIAIAGHRRRQTQKVGTLFDRSTPPVSTGL